MLDATRYERASALLGANLKGLVLNEAVHPHWLGDSDRFWYRRELIGGHEFVLVDALTGRSRPAFDHEAMTEVLKKVIGSSDPTNLPLRDLRFAKGEASISVLTDTGWFHCTLGNGPRLEGRSPVRVHPGVETSPDGRFGLQVRSGNLWLLDLHHGGERRLTDDGSIDAGYAIHPDSYGSSFVPRRRVGQEDRPVGVSWAPDGSRVVVPFFDQRHVPAYPLIDSIPEDGGLRPSLFEPRLPLVGEPPARVSWFMFDIPTGARRKADIPTATLLALQADLLPLAEIIWLTGGHRFFVVAFASNMEGAFLFEVDAATGKSRVVLEERALPRTDLNPTSYSMPNVWVSSDGAEVLWYSQRDGWGNLYRYDGQTGEYRGRVTEGGWVVRDIIKVDEERGLVFFTGSGREAGNPYYRYLYEAHFDGSGLRLLSPEAADHHLTPTRRLVYSPDGLDPYDPISPSGRRLVYSYSTVSEPPVTLIRSLGSLDVISVVETADASALFATGWSPPREFVTKAADGVTDLWGVAYLPPGVDVEARYPVLDAQYASPLIAVAPRNFIQAHEQAPELSQSAFAELGFIVVTVDGRGTAYRSRDFSQAMFGRLNTCGLEDHVAAIRGLAADLPFMDLSRVGIYGVSYGGYVSIRAMLEFPDFFKAGIATAPIAVMAGMYADYHWSAFQGRPEYADGGNMKPQSAETPANWVGLDSREDAANLQGHLFIQQGEVDENVLPGQVMQFIDALIEANKDFDLLIMPGRSHRLLSEGYVWRRNFDFMLGHLSHESPPESPPRIVLRT